MSQGDMEHAQLQRDLGVQPHEEIPPQQMDAAVRGEHGPDVQRRATSVKSRLHGPGMRDIFSPSRKTSKGSAAPPAPQHAAPAPKQRLRFGKEE
jgi:hypothetical protein